MLLVAMLLGLAAPGQDTVAQAGLPTTLPAVEVIAPVEEGAATLECRVNRDGRLRDCIVISETPAGEGLGAAALEAATRARLSPRTRNRAASDAKVRFTTRVRLEDSASPLT
jgi:TonB family protein